VAETEGLTPKQIVAELDRYIVGQDEAKRAVAIALRNRWRRQRLGEDIREEVIPKNILMIGPTGVGKTEIARRLARLAGAPFIKVEATKFTEVGYVGRDVDSIIRDLVEQAVRMTQQAKMAEVQDRAREAAEEALLDLLLPGGRREEHATPNPFQAMASMLGQRPYEEGEQPPQPGPEQGATREKLRARLRAGQMEQAKVEVEVEEARTPFMQVFSPQGLEEMGMNLQDMLGGMMPKGRRRRTVTVAEARELLTYQQAQRLVDQDQVVSEAIRAVEENGIVFLDELDKVAGREGTHGPDVSREGVQRDILPIVEGSTVTTKYGPVRTDHVLFIAAGAFHVSKPSDLIPELQGRFPLRVELSRLGEEDFVRILSEPQNSLIRQYSELLAVDGVNLEFTPEGIREIASLARQVNEQAENIGARRLHTMMEKLVEEVSYHAPDIRPTTVRITAEYVRERLQGLAGNVDLSRYIL